MPYDDNIAEKKLKALERQQPPMGKLKLGPAMTKKFPHLALSHTTTNSCTDHNTCTDADSSWGDNAVNESPMYSRN